jgi:hypothetical protein
MEPGGDIIEFCREAPGPILILSHPASGTKWMQAQLQAALEGPVAHEILHGRPIRDYKAVITFKHWHSMTLDKYACIVAMTRDPIKVIPSTFTLYKKTPHIRGMVLSHFFGDGIPRGAMWSAAQAQPPYESCLSTLDAWYEKAHQIEHRIEEWFRVEDAKEIIDAPSNTKLHKHNDADKKTTTWEEIINTDPNVATRLLLEARRMGYEIPAQFSAVL